MIDLKKIADAADVIVNGYAFIKCELRFQRSSSSFDIRKLILLCHCETIECDAGTKKTHWIGW